MEKLKSQFSTVSKLLFSEETRQTYSQAIALTLSIVRELLSLSWLLFCSIFLIFFWGGNYARQAGQNIRTWYSDMDEEQKKNIVGSAAGTLKESLGGSLSTSSSSLSLVDIAKSQLDIKSDPPALKALPSAPKVEKKDVVEDDEVGNLENDKLAAEDISSVDEEKLN